MGGEGDLPMASTQATCKKRSTGSNTRGDDDASDAFVVVDKEEVPSGSAGKGSDSARSSSKMKNRQSQVPENSCFMTEALEAVG